MKGCSGGFFSVAIETDDLHEVYEDCLNVMYLLDRSSLPLMFIDPRR